MQHMPLWWSADDLSGTSNRTSLDSDQDFDVVIIGAGFTGLWTAYYLAKQAPHLKIAILESAFVGYGASGRNGGWLAASVPGSLERYAKTSNKLASINLARAMVGTVDEVIEVAAREGIEFDLLKSGCIRLATSPAQAKRLTAAVAYEQIWDGGAEGWNMESPSQIAERIATPRITGGAFTPNCARINPYKLVIGLARSVEKLGVQIFENSKVTEYGSGYLKTASHRITSQHLIRATEGFTCHLPGQTRTLLPMNSSIIATEPLSESIWSEIGWSGAETFSDIAHAYVYLQRTADGRIAIGGRGNPYIYAGKFESSGITSAGTTDSLRRVLHRLFPATTDSIIDFAWSGVLGVPRDWCAGVGYDQYSGLGWAGGYTGEGVAATNLAGRTLADLIQGKKTELTSLPWVNRKARKWEIEPFRWLGVQSIYAAYRKADEIESTRESDEQARVAKIAHLISGR